MTSFNAITNQFNRGANVGNLVFVLLSVVIGIIKPAGALME